MKNPKDHSVQNANAKNEEHCDIFISYRREDGTATAMHLYDVLSSKGYRVFLDMNTLNAGDFTEAIVDQIEHCTDFIIVLSPHALQRLDDEDWVRRELACALRNGKNVIPVMDPIFHFPESLPDDICAIKNMNGIKLIMEVFQAIVDKIISFLKTPPPPPPPPPPSPPWKKNLIVAVVILLALAGIAFFAFNQGNKKGNEPTAAPQTSPTAMPAETPSPTLAPTESVTVTEDPTAAPTAAPTESVAATEEPTAAPTAAPTESVTATEEPTAAPTAAPSPEPATAETAAEDSQGGSGTAEVPVLSQDETESTSPQDLYAAYAPAASQALDALEEALAQYQRCVYVYKDFGDSENHFTQRMVMAGRDASRVRPMEDNWQKETHSGDSCIRCKIITKPDDWGGWLFVNGYLPKDGSEPQLNKADAPNQGMNLTGADELRFWARGEKGGETVQFLVGGFQVGSGAMYPDSCETQRLDYLALEKEWTEYVIDLRDVDTSYLICGFGFAMAGGESMDAADASGTAENVFYLDDIRFVGHFPDVHPLIRSYDSADPYLKNTAFSYDNALVSMAFMSAGKQEEAKQILDAFVYAVRHDRYRSGRVRNAYVAGDITSIPGWGSSARLPVWYDAGTGAWQEHQHHVGSDTGNTACVALALLQYHAQYGGETYMNAAKELMDWVLDECGASAPGFTAGYDGWPENGSDSTDVLTYKSIEHNIQAYAAFKRLADVTGEKKYRDAAGSALQFITSLYDSKRGVFHTGTLADGVTVSEENTVLDAQVLACLALGDEFWPYEDALKTVDKMKVKNGGYSFSKANVNGGWWTEGTAFTALMQRLRGEDEKAAAALDALLTVQTNDGLFPAATVKNLSTGIYLADGTPVTYGNEPYIAPAAWLIMAVNQFNPYSFE